MKFRQAKRNFVICSASSANGEGLQTLAFKSANRFGFNLPPPATPFTSPGKNELDLELRSRRAGIRDMSLDDREREIMGVPEFGQKRMIRTRPCQTTASEACARADRVPK